MNIYFLIAYSYGVRYQTLYSWKGGVPNDKPIEDGKNVFQNPGVMVNTKLQQYTRAPEKNTSDLSPDRRSQTSVDGTAVHFCKMGL